MEEFLTLKELAAYLKIAEKTLYAHAMNGKVPGIRIGAAWRFRKSDIETWLEDLRKTTEESTKKNALKNTAERDEDKPAEPVEAGNGTKKKRAPL